MEGKRSYRLRQNPHARIDRRSLHCRPLIDGLAACCPPEHKRIPASGCVDRLIPRLTKTEKISDFHSLPPKIERKKGTCIPVSACDFCIHFQKLFPVFQL